MQRPTDTRVARPELVEVLDTQAGAPARSPSVWSDLVQLACGPVRVAWERDSFFQGSITRGKFGAMQTSLVQADPHSVQRDARLVEQAGEAPLYICAVLDGEALVTQDGREAAARAGDLVVYDSSRPYTFATQEPIRMVAVKFAHRMAGLTPGEPHSLLASTFSGRQGVGALLLQLLEGLAGQMTEVTDVSADRLGDSVNNLIAAVLAERLTAGVPDAQAGRQALLLRIQQFAREHLGDPDLSPVLLARQHSISLRYLQLLFSEQNASPARWIRDERLARCQDDLLNPRYDHLTVASIGERWGLPGASHFSRLFRERYDVTPREWRREGRIPAALSA